jgi:hypothetical protein
MTVMTGPVAGNDLRELVHLVRQGAEANDRPDLVRRLRAAAEDVAAARPVAPVAATVVRALQSLEIDLRSRRAALSDSGRGARLAAEARHAESRLRQFQERTARLPRVLGDALSATDSDVEFAIQNWLRALLEEGTAVIESGLLGDDLDRWLRKRFVTEVEAVHRALRSAAAEVGAKVAASLGVTSPVPSMTLELGPPEELVAHIHRGPRALSDRQPLATRLTGVLMPTYSGMMLALVLPRLFGFELSLVTTLALAVGGAFALGGSAMAGERQRQRSRRNAENAIDLRSTVDAFRMAVSKRVRDGTRSIEQQLYANLTEAVTRQTRQLSGAADSSRRMAENSGRGPEALNEIDLDLESIRDLLLRAQRITFHG